MTSLLFQGLKSGYVCIRQHGFSRSVSSRWSRSYSYSSNSPTKGPSGAFLGKLSRSAFWRRRNEVALSGGCFARYVHTSAEEVKCSLTVVDLESARKGCV